MCVFLHAHRSADMERRNKRVPQQDHSSHGSGPRGFAKLFRNFHDARPSQRKVARLAQSRAMGAQDTSLPYSLAMFFSKNVHASYTDAAMKKPFGRLSKEVYVSP